MLLPAGVTTLSASDTANVAKLRGTVSVLQVRGPADLSPHPVWVWRPPGPDSAQLPVLYFLHGYPGGGDDVFGEGAARLLDGLLEQGYPPFVLASVDGNGERHSDTEWANSYDGSEQVMARVVDGAIPAVEGSHMRDAAHRAIAGFSMGGYGAMNIAMQSPGLFGQEVSIAGYYVTNDLSGMFGGRGGVLRQNTPLDHPSWASGMRVYLAEDASDPFPLIRGQAPQMAARLRAAGVPVTVSITPGTHSWSYAISALRSAFAFLYNNWRTAATTTSFTWPPH